MSELQEMYVARSIVKIKFLRFLIIPAQAEIQCRILDFRLCGNDWDLCNLGVTEHEATQLSVEDGCDESLHSGCFWFSFPEISSSIALIF